MRRDAASYLDPIRLCRRVAAPAAIWSARVLSSAALEKFFSVTWVSVVFLLFVILCSRGFV